MKKSSANCNRQKEKRLARKQEQHKIADGMALVTAANKQEDYDSLCKDLLLLAHGGFEVRFYIKRVTKLEKSVIDWAIDLTECNMKTLYESCAWGWNKNKKVEEMTDDSAWYVVATDDVKGIPLGFSHFRFDMDYGEPVLYCYEVQVDVGVRRCGIGSRLLEILETIARGTQMHCIRLTVLTHNITSSQFFASCGYTLDKTSPPLEEAVHYEIFSKSTQKSDSEEETASTSNS